MLEYLLLSDQRCGIIFWIERSTIIGKGNRFIEHAILCTTNPTFLIHGI